MHSQTRIISGQAKKERQPVVAVDAEKNTWALHGEVQAVLDRASSESIPPFRDDKANDSLAVRNAQASPPNSQLESYSPLANDPHRFLHLPGVC